MTQQYNNPKPEKKPIETAGVYKLRLAAPKVEYVQTYEDGTCSASLYFSDANGNYLKKVYGTKYGQSLAMLVGKISKQYIPTVSPTISAEQFVQLINKAAGITFDAQVDITGSKQGANGKTYLNYKLSILGGKEKQAEQQDGGAIPF